MSLWVIIIKRKVWGRNRRTRGDRFLAGLQWELSQMASQLGTISWDQVEVKFKDNHFWDSCLCDYTNEEIFLEYIRKQPYHYTKWFDWKGINCLPFALASYRWLILPVPFVLLRKQQNSPAQSRLIFTNLPRKMVPILSFVPLAITDIKHKKLTESEKINNGQSNKKYKSRHILQDQLLI